MQTTNRISLLHIAFAAFLAFATIAIAADNANVAGTWNISVAGENAAEQTVTFTQDGSKLTGTFKGPRQSGAVAGSVTGNAITFHVSARMPLDYNGTVDGDSMKGTLTARGKTANWTATRAK